MITKGNSDWLVPFQFFDESNTGFVDSSSFKRILRSFGLRFSEIVK